MWLLETTTSTNVSLSYKYRQVGKLKPQTQKLFSMRCLWLILVLTLVPITDTNIVTEATNVKLLKTNGVEQDPRQYDQMLPRGPVPPSGPNHGYDPPPRQFDQMLPRGPVPPSGPNHGYDPPPGQFDPMLPRGPVPPSGPSHGYDPPPQKSSELPDVLPPPNSRIRLPKGVPHPPEGPSHGSTPDPPRPPPTP